LETILFERKRDDGFRLFGTPIRGATPQLVINLANDYSYNSEGYYCSLLAQARGHRVIPGVDTLNKLESGMGIRMSDVLQKQCHQYITHNNLTETWSLNIYFGQCKEKGLEKIARFIFDNYPSPLLRVTFNTQKRNQLESVQSLPLNRLSDSEQDDFADASTILIRKCGALHVALNQRVTAWLFCRPS